MQALAHPAIRRRFRAAAAAAALLAALVGRGAKAQGDEAGASPQPAFILRHLTNDLQGFRLAGEIADSEWPLYLTARQARDAPDFQIGYISAVSVMPEASTLTLSINGRTIGATPIRGAASERTVRFAVPPGVLKAGFNRVRMIAEERHRVDCSISATYELWTQIDPSRTGLLVPANDPGVTNIGDLPALAPDDDGALPIRVVLPAHVTREELQRVIRAVESLTLVGRFEQPKVTIGPLAGGAYGVNLVIGASRDVARLLPNLPIAQFGPRLEVVPASSGVRTTIVATGATQSEVDEAVAQIAAARHLFNGSLGGLAASSFPGYPVKGGMRVTVRRLGLHSEEFSGRLFRASFNLLMPPDFYSADYAKVFVDLAGGYAPGLSAGAEVLVKINGHDASSLRLPDSGGDVFRDASIPLPLGAMRPGLNRVEIEAHLPKAGDRHCDPIAMAEGPNRFLFLNSTSIVIPPIARIARMPDLAVTATGGFPYGGKGFEPVLWEPLPDRDSVSAAAEIAAHLSLAAGRPIHFRFAVRRPRQDAGPVLVVAPIGALGESLFSAVRLDAQRLDQIWSRFISTPPGGASKRAPSAFDLAQRHRETLESNVPFACHMRGAPAGLAENSDPDETGAISQTDRRRPDFAYRETDRNASSLEREWKLRIEGRNVWRKWMTNLPGAVGDLLKSGAASVGGWFGERPGGPHRKRVLGRSASLVVAQSLRGDDAAHVWTLVTAPTSRRLDQAVNCLMDPSVWAKLSGRVAAVDAADGTVAARPVRDARLIVTQPLSIENTRLIIAGWFSLNGGVYVLVALVAALGLALSTTWFVRNVGRRTT